MSFDMFLYIIIVVEFVLILAQGVRIHHWRKVARAEYLGRRRIQLRAEFRTLDKDGRER